MFSDQTIDIDTSIPVGLIMGAPSSDLLEGTEIDNIFDPWYGSDVIKGNGGSDKVLIFSERQYFDITTNDQGVTYLTGLSGSDGYYGSVMELNEISKIVFSDQEINVVSYQVVTSIGTTYLNEGEATSLSLRLSTAPTEDVTVSFSGDRFTFLDGSTASTSITFNTSNWNTEKLITVYAKTDTVINPIGSSDIVFSITTDDENYKEISLEAISVSINDDDSSLHSITGSIWNDEDGDGVKDDSEPYQEGWTVYLDTNQNRLRDSDEPFVTTDSAGKYVFNGLDAGTYFVGVDLPLGWGQTKPETASTKSVSIGISEGGSGGTTTHDSNNSVYHSAYQSIIGLSDFQNNTKFAQFDGSGSTIVIIDTGADLDHPHFGPDSNGDGIADKILHSYDFYYDDSDATDYNGHGTHVAGTAAGSDKQFPGVAPGANLIILKVFSDGETKYADGVQEALDWIVKNTEKYNIVAVNMSLGTSSYDTSPTSGYVSEQLQSLASLGVIVVAASGNSYTDKYENPDAGPTNMLGNDWDSLGVDYPSSDPWAFSIGASEHSDTGLYLGYLLETSADWIVPFSNRDDELTTIFSPGYLIVAANYQGGVKQESGTSMAAPIVTGAVAVIQQIAESLFGQRLTFKEMEKLLKDYGDKIFDVAHGDTLYHSGDEYSRLDILQVAEALIALAGPGQYSVALSSGNDATNLDFGVTTLESGAPGETGILVGTYFSDRLDGSSGVDKIYGGPGNDEIYGNEGADVIYGGDGNDIIEGNEGADAIYGGDGNDIIEGGAGIDTLTGGKGRDTFKFLSLTDLGDTITDFTGGAEGDVIAVKTLLSALGYDSDDPFVDGWLQLEQVGADTLIKLDKDGGGDNFDTLVVTLQSFTLADFKRENIDPESSIWKASGAQATSLPSMTIDSGSLDIDLSNISNQSPSGINISLEDLNLDDLPILEENNKIELNLEEDLSDILLEVKDSDPVTESVDNEIGYVLNAVYEEDELLFAGLEI